MDSDGDVCQLRVTFGLDLVVGGTGVLGCELARGTWPTEELLSRFTRAPDAEAKGLEPAVRLFSASMGSVLGTRLGRAVDGLTRLVAGTGWWTSPAAERSTVLLASGTGLRAPRGAVSDAKLRTAPERFPAAGSVRAVLVELASGNLGR